MTGMAKTYGFIGTGEITAAIVRGLNRADPPPVFLSPRNHRIGRELAEEFGTVRVCASNQEVLDNAEVIVLAVRPPITREVLAELTFRPGHVVISAIAGIPLDDLRAWVAPAGRTVRSIPLPQAAEGESLTALYPYESAAAELYGRVGGIVVPETEEALTAISAASATFAAHLDYLSTIADWLTGHGLSDEAAHSYLAHVFGQLGRSLLRHEDALRTMTEKHTTPGGTNEQLKAELRENGVPDTVRAALDSVLARLTTS